MWFLKDWGIGFCHQVFDFSNFCLVVKNMGVCFLFFVKSEILKEMVTKSKNT